jgi:hypothetical protein
LQDIHGLHDRWSLALIVMRAPEAREEHSPHLLLVKLAVQPSICHSNNQVLAVHVTDPIQQQWCSFWFSRGWPLAASDL